MQNPASTIRDVQGTPVAWREAGPADAPAAVLLHGLGGNRTTWGPQLDGLSDVRRCLAWDAPGYGLSAGLPGTLPELAATVAEWLAGLGITSADVVGLSFGGMIAQHLALDHPHLVRSLALVDTSPAFGLDGVTTKESWLATRVDPIRAEQPSPERARQVVAGLVAETCPDEIREVAIASMREVPGATLAASCRALVDHDTRGRLPEISAPTLVMVGAEDAETPPSYAKVIADLVPGAAFEVVPGAGHLLNLEAPDIVNARLREHWLSAVPQEDAP